MIDNDFSDNSSFIGLTNGLANNANEAKIAELERDKEFLAQKIQLLEKNNQELMAYKKHVESTIQLISKETDEKKKL